MLQLWQWRNPRRHWLLKAPSHLNYLPTLFRVFPDARVVMTHRDPRKAQASVANLAGTFYWMRSDKPMDVNAFEGLLSPVHMAARLDRVIDWEEEGTIPKAQCFNSLYADLIAEPLEALRKLYRQMNMPLDAETEAKMIGYLAGKPKGKFGTHRYENNVGSDELEQRKLFQRYQVFFNVPDER